MKQFYFSLKRRHRPFAFSFLCTGITLIILILKIVSGCKKNNNIQSPTVPVIKTAPLTNIIIGSATTGGTIVSDGNSTITLSGIVWSKLHAIPTLTDSTIPGILLNGSFTINLTSLDSNTPYYIRAYATNSVGTGYGNVVTYNVSVDTTKVRFTYNGKSVTYGIITSLITGRKWLDRNIGAKRVATSYDDYEAYGDLFQWGRPADGHQLINWTSSITGTTVNGITTTLATSDDPGHNKFIGGSASSNYDWRDNNNSNRWVTVSQGPCPTGWHVPKKSEWAAEISDTQYGGMVTAGGITDRNTAYDQLKLTTAGYRYGQDSDAGLFNRAGSNGYYWSSFDLIIPLSYSQGVSLSFTSNIAQLTAYDKAMGLCVRCLMN